MANLWEYGMIYVYRCLNCQGELERSESPRGKHEYRGFCPECGAADRFKRVLFPGGKAPQVIYRGNPRGFAGKIAAQEKQYREALAIANGAYRAPSKNPISQSDGFWQRAAQEFDSYRPTLYGDSREVSHDREKDPDSGPSDSG